VLHGPVTSQHTTVLTQVSNQLFASFS